MAFYIIITKDFSQMSEEAGKIVLKELEAFEPTEKKDKYILGLATGNSPIGLYQYLVDNQDKFEAKNIISFNLDEYIGLPGENPQLRTLHPESYSYFMIQQLFGKLEKSFGKITEKSFFKTYVPYGNMVDQNELIKALNVYPNDYQIMGADAGKAIVISDSAKNEYLKWIKKEILDAYEKKINDFNGIDLQIIGVGGRGHVAFHESGIPLDLKMLLVQLDKNTIENAVKAGHFKSIEESPQYAISMGAGLVYEAKTVILLANGESKIDPVKESLFGEVTDKVPISYGQEYARKGGNMIYVIDAIAAKGIIGREKELMSKGIKVIQKAWSIKK